jgi:hypothetical protein
LPTNEEMNEEEGSFEAHIRFDFDTGLMNVTFPDASIIETDAGPVMGFKITPLGLVNFGHYLANSAAETMDDVIGELLSEDDDDDED